MPAVASREKSVPRVRVPKTDPFNARGPARASAPGAGEKPEAEILFQNYFKSVGPRTYAAQVKRAGNGNHFLVLTEGKRDESTGDIRKTRLFVFSEDFVAFFRMLHETAKYIRENPVPDDVRKQRQQFWARHNKDGKKPAEVTGGRPGAPASSPAPGAPTRSPVARKPSRVPRG